MKKFLICLVLFSLIESVAFGQQKESSKFYFGTGYGLDYAGVLGVKIEYLPIKYFGIFASGGYNLLSLAFNIGGTYKILPNKRISPNIMAMYGYNSVLINADSYGMVSVNPFKKHTGTDSYGLTIGVNLDIKIGKRNKISSGIFIPFRDKDFKKTVNESYLTTPLLPVLFSVGFNFGC
jgi:hypothetical protein